MESYFDKQAKYLYEKAEEVINNMVYNYETEFF